jgi:hypothetical protein
VRSRASRDGDPADPGMQIGHDQIGTPPDGLHRLGA